MKKLIYIFFIIGVGIILSCSPSNKKLQADFEANFEANVQGFMKPFVDRGEDPAKARAFAECMINAIFELEPTFFSLDFENEFEKIYQLTEKNQPEALRRCECLLE